MDWRNLSGSLPSELLLGSPFASTVKLQRRVLQTVNTLDSSVFFNLSNTLAWDTAALVRLPAHAGQLFQTLEVEASGTVALLSRPVL